MQYAVFSDESSHTDGDFRSIAAVSLPANPLNRVVDWITELSDQLDCSEKGELKWRNVGRGGWKNVQRAQKAIDFTISKVSHDLRVDILIWDIHDSRHSVEHRDDRGNYARMFYHLHRYLMRLRGQDTNWYLRPDTLWGIDWSTIYDCLSSEGTFNKGQSPKESLFNDICGSSPKVRNLREVDSKETPLVQLADLFAGMAVFTRSKSDIIKVLQLEGSNQLEFFPKIVSTYPDPSETDRGRYKVVSYLYEQCRQARLGVSLKKQGYLITHKPKNPINFWHYTPQHAQDRAPSRQKNFLTNQVHVLS